VVVVSVTVLDYKVKDIGLAEQGELNLTWAADHMPVLGIIRERFEREKPLKGLTIAASLHCTKETGVLIRVLEHQQRAGLQARPDYR
jgi:adenosylhomocysteinase